MIYTIKKGNHYASNLLLRWPFFFGDRMRYRVQFDKTAIYDIGEEDQADWNKLPGFSIGWNPFKTSVRPAWRFNKQSFLIELGAYFHVNGKFEHYYLGDMLFTDTVDFVLVKKKIANTEKPFSITQVKLFTEIIGIKGPKWFYKFEKMLYAPYKKYGFKLYPFFGGNQTAPHNIKISIRKI